MVDLSGFHQLYSPLRVPATTNKSKVNVLTYAVDLHFLSVIPGECDAHSALLDEVHPVGRVPLPDDLLLVLKLARYQCVGQVCPLVRLQCLQHGHLVKQLLVHLALAEGGLKEDAAEGLAVHGPQRARRLGAHRGRTGHVVHERQLAEATRAVVRVHRAVLPVWSAHQHVKLSAVEILKMLRFATLF